MEYSYLLCLFIICMGTLWLFKPDFNWKWKEQWKIEDHAEPSSDYLLAMKIKGICIIITGIVFLIILHII